MTKSDLRNEIKLILQSHKNEMKNLSDRICDDILSSDFYKNAQIILAYMALPDEVNLFNVICAAQSQQKKVFIPKVQKNSCDMDFYEWNPHLQTITGSFGIQEPSADNKKFLFSDFPNKNILILVPGRAFTNEGCRLGRGKGYYDSFFNNSPINKNCTLAGVCFPFQILPDIPTEPYDFKMHFVIK